MSHYFNTFFSFFFFLSTAMVVAAKSTIEPCSGSDSCPALLGYTLYTDLKISEVATLFQVDAAALLAANAFDAALPGVAHRILPAGLFIRVPTLCSCADGIRKSVSVRYLTRPADTLTSIAATVFAGLASADQIREANSIADPSNLDAGQNLLVPLPCTCFNSSDNGLPAVYLSYVVQSGDAVPALAARYSTTVTDIMNVNSMGSPSTRPGDILAIPLPACPSMFPSYASDYGLIIADGTYTITAGHCVQCSCGPGNSNIYCTPAPLSASCSSMQCRNSNLMIGNVTAESTSAGCNVTSCDYGGFVNGSIITTLTTSLQPRCPGPYQFPTLAPLPTWVSHDSLVTPSLPPAQSQPGGIMPTPRTSIPGTFSFPGASPASGPTGSTSEAPLLRLLNHRKSILIIITLALIILM